VHAWCLRAHVHATPRGVCPCPRAKKEKRGGRTLCSRSAFSCSRRKASSPPSSPAGCGGGAARRAMATGRALLLLLLLLAATGGLVSSLPLASMLLYGCRVRGAGRGVRGVGVACVWLCVCARARMRVCAGGRGWGYWYETVRAENPFVYLRPKYCHSVVGSVQEALPLSHEGAWGNCRGDLRRPPPGARSRALTLGANRMPRALNTPPNGGSGICLFMSFPAVTGND
jgi:hypothetical protein